MNPTDEGLAVLCTTTSDYETDIVCGLLESEGLWNERRDAFHARSVLSVYGGESLSDQGHAIVVRDGDLERARHVLEEARPATAGEPIDRPRTPGVLLAFLGCAVLLAALATAWKLGWLQG